MTVQQTGACVARPGQDLGSVKIWGQVLQSNNYGGKYLRRRESGTEFGGDSFEALFPFEMRDALHAATAMVHLIRQHSQRLPLGEKVPDTFGEVTP